MGATFNSIYSLFYGKHIHEEKHKGSIHTPLMQWLLNIVRRGPIKIFRAAVIMEHSSGHSDHITKLYPIMDGI